MIQKFELSTGKRFELDLPESGNVGILVSGGADSAILLYLLAKTIKENNLLTQIFPITGEILKRPFNLRHSSDVLEKVEQMTGYQFPFHLNFLIPNHKGEWTDQRKIAIKSKYTADLSKRYDLQCLFNALTSNPPERDLPSKPCSNRPDRDSDQWREQQKKLDGQRVPFIELDKRDIAALYHQFGLLNELFPLTRSCEGEGEVTANFTRPCNEILPEDKVCWWCRERQYAFAPYL